LKIDVIIAFKKDAIIYLCNLEKGKNVSVAETSGRRIFLYLAPGRLIVNNHKIFSKEQARIDIDNPLAIKAITDSEYILIDIPSYKGLGYTSKALQGARK